LCFLLCLLDMVLSLNKLINNIDKFQAGAIRVKFKWWPFFEIREPRVAYAWKARRQEIM